MPRPNIALADVLVPGTQSLMQGFPQPCGVSYDTPVAVVQPYKGTDKWSHEIPARSGLIEVPATPADLDVALQSRAASQALLDGEHPGLPARLVDDLNEAVGPGILKVYDPASLTALQNMIDRSSMYALLAAQLWNYWADEYQPTVVAELLPPTSGPPRGIPLIQAQMPHWPLNDPTPVFPDCLGQPPGTVIKVEQGGWRAQVACPSQLTAGGRQADKTLYAQLVLAAMLWARCAEETTAVVGIHHLNRAEYEDEIGGLVLAPQTPDPAPPIADPGPPPPLPPPPPIGPQPPPPEPPEPPATPDPEGPGEVAPPPEEPPPEEPPPEEPPAEEPAPIAPAMPSVQPSYVGWIVGGLAVAAIAVMAFSQGVRQPES